jgi:hypothetical protein
MDTCSYFIKDKALFGSYPSEIAVKELEDNGVRYFVNLTHDDEDKIKQYHTNYQSITYKIKDRSVPTDLLSFSHFIIQIGNIIKHLNNEKVYIHCKGGHGRSGLVVACLICYIFKLSAYESLNYTSKCHNNRSVMREKWRKIGAPQTYLQKRFVHQLFRPINFARMHKGMFSIYSSDAKFSINKGLSFLESIHEGMERNLNLKTLYENKINQNDDLKNFLHHTYLRPIVSYDNNNDISKQICDILTDLRQNLYFYPTTK